MKPDTEIYQNYLKAQKLASLFEKLAENTMEEIKGKKIPPDTGINFWAYVQSLCEQLLEAAEHIRSLSCAIYHARMTEGQLKEKIKEYYHSQS